MKTRTAATPLLLALVAAALVAPSGSSAASSCTAGITKIGGKSARTFCGPAKAHATIGSKSFSFSGGECTKSGTYFTINIGTLVLHKVASSKPGPATYFGVTVAGDTPGVHLKQVLAWNTGGTAYTVLHNSITLKSGLKSGTFSGHSINGQKIKGSFSC